MAGSDRQTDTERQNLKEEENLLFLFIESKDELVSLRRRTMVWLSFFFDATIEGVVSQLPSYEEPDEKILSTLICVH